MKKMAQIEISQLEGEAMIAMIDIALKSQGTEILQPAFILTNKIRLAFKESSDEEEDGSTNN